VDRDREGEEPVSELEHTDRTDLVVQVIGGPNPETIRDALDVHVRLDALKSWADDRKGEVRRWIGERADQRRDEDGAAPTWRLGDDVGTVLQTDPKPSPRISDREPFAEWYVREVLADNPDRDPEHGHLVTFSDDVARRTVATCRSDALLEFLDRVAGDDFEAAANAASDLADRIDTDDEWLLSEDLLERLLAGKIDPSGGKPRLALVERKDPGGEWVVLDRETGEVVPGTTVAPPGARTVQVKPTPALKASVRAELDALIGPAKLGQGGTTR
jgi:hypothetical protein